MEPGQVALFHETIEDALGADVAALGGPKKAGHLLFPHLDPAAAGAMLRAALNDNRSEKLSPAQVLLLKRLAAAEHSYATVTYEAQQLGYRVTWLDPQDEADELRRDVRDLLKAVNQRLARIERVETNLKVAT